MAVIIREEYFLRAILLIVAPITHEIDARIIRILPRSIVEETFPVMIWGRPIIISAPAKPNAIPERLTRYTFSFKNHHPIRTDNMGIIKVNTEASMTLVRLMPSKKKVILSVIIKTPMQISFGKSFLSILTFLLSAKKNGARSKDARAKRRNARLMGGNSCKVTLATTKLTPQIKWARIKAI